MGHSARVREIHGCGGSKNGYLQNGHRNASSPGVGPGRALDLSGPGDGPRRRPGFPGSADGAMWFSVGLAGPETPRASAAPCAVRREPPRPALGSAGPIRGVCRALVVSGRPPRPTPVVPAALPALGARLVRATRAAAVGALALGLPASALASAPGPLPSGEELPDVGMGFVTAGDPGDPAYRGDRPQILATVGRGVVGYRYRITRSEVSAGDYSERHRLFMEASDELEERLDVAGWAIPGDRWYAGPDVLEWLSPLYPNSDRIPIAAEREQGVMYPHPAAQRPDVGPGRPLPRGEHARPGRRRGAGHAQPGRPLPAAGGR